MDNHFVQNHLLKTAIGELKLLKMKEALQMQRFTAVTELCKVLPESKYLHLKEATCRLIEISDITYRYYFIYGKFRKIEISFRDD